MWFSDACTPHKAGVGNPFKSAVDGLLWIAIGNGLLKDKDSITVQSPAGLGALSR
jgi:hypothetical protein